MKQVIKPAKAAAPVGPYSHAIRVGQFLFCSGQIPLDPATCQLVAGDIRAQTERVLLNIQAILADQNLKPEDVVKTTVFLTKMEDFAAMNEVYGRHFSEQPPARAGVQAAKLPKGSLVEIEAIAVK